MAEEVGSLIVRLGMEAEAEFAVLEKGIRDMAKEIPAAATEIAKVAENAGQLGIQKDAILGFSRVMVDLGVATDMASVARVAGMSATDFRRAFKIMPQ